ncbi:MAG: hypothetical protein K0R92_1718 [Lachnospiraceae bacterium]|jgi:nondiscriminating aspartyl-tRNA synthetase|nr:hypothetical protein [Lachnospiraceae bacterium]
MSKEKREETLSFDLLFRGLIVTTGGQGIHSYQEQVKYKYKSFIELDNLHLKFK